MNPHEFLKPEEIRLTIPGLKKDYTFLHISDAHLAAADSTCPEAEQKLATERTDYWTPEGGILPQDALKKCLSYAKDLKTDCVFLTGDAVDYCSVCNIDAVRNCIRQAGAEVLYVRGNHEGLKEYHGLYSDLMGENPDLIVKDFGELLLVGIDNGFKEITDEQLVALRCLNKRGVPILLIMHLPVMTEAITPPVMEKWGPSFLLGVDTDSNNAKSLQKFLTKEPNHIAAIFAGHVHFRHEGEFAPGKYQYTAAPAFEGYCRVVRVTGKEL